VKTRYGRGKGQPPGKHRLIAESYPCPTCGAPPGSPCLTWSGLVKHEQHVERIAHVARCLYCNQWLAADTVNKFCDECSP
jgi:hypothetical protein